RSGQQIQVFNGHTSEVLSAEYSPFVIKNIDGDSNVICSGSYDNTIRFWDIRSNKNQLYIIKGDEQEDGIRCLKFIELKKKEKTKNGTYDLSLCYVFLFEKFDKKGNVQFFLKEMKILYKYSNYIINVFNHDNRVDNFSFCIA
ncbi:hypothetical protein RFI_11932, partial [Reticulomyxa filosa]